MCSALARATSLQSVFREDIMSYSSGSATSAIDLVQQLSAWLVTLGWTSDLSAAVGSGWRAHLHKGSNYLHMRAAMNEIILGSHAGYGVGLYLSTSFSSAAAWDAQPGSPPVQSGTSTVLGAAMQLASGSSIPNVYFFADATADNIVVVAAQTPGIFTHLGFGSSLAKTGTWTGGAYFFAAVGGSNFGLSAPAPGSQLSAYCPGGDSDWGQDAAMFVRADVDSFAGKWLGVSPTTGLANGYTGKVAESSVYTSVPPSNSLARYKGASGATFLQDRLTSVLHAEASLLPVLIWAARDSGGYSLLGSLPFIFASNGVGNGFAAAEVYPFGSDNFTMFPNFAVKKQ
jgi:hypothetical protein